MSTLDLLSYYSPLPDQIHSTPRYYVRVGSIDELNSPCLIMKGVRTFSGFMLEGRGNRRHIFPCAHILRIS